MDVAHKHVCLGCDTVVLQHVDGKARAAHTCGRETRDKEQRMQGFQQDCIHHPKRKVDFVAPYVVKNLPGKSGQRIWDESASSIHSCPRPFLLAENTRGWKDCGGLCFSSALCSQ